MEELKFSLATVKLTISWLVSNKPTLRNSWANSRDGSWIFGLVKGNARLMGLEILHTVPRRACQKSDHCELSKPFNSLKSPFLRLWKATLPLSQRAIWKTACVMTSKTTAMGFLLFVIGFASCEFRQCRQKFGHCPNSYPVTGKTCLKVFVLCFHAFWSVRKCPLRQGKHRADASKPLYKQTNKHFKLYHCADWQRAQRFCGQMQSEKPECWNEIAPRIGKSIGSNGRLFLSHRTRVSWLNLRVPYGSAHSKF